MKRAVLALSLGLGFALPVHAIDIVAIPKWTYSHSALSSEIAAFARYTDSTGATRREIWSVGTAGIDILDPFTSNASGSLLGNIPVLNGNSVATYGRIAAVAVNDAVKTDPGTVRFYDMETRTLLSTVTVGANPDMIAFSPDGTRLLVANEGEAQYSADSATATVTADAPGSVSILSISGTGTGQTFSASVVATKGFTAAEGFTVAGLQANGVRIQPIAGNASPTEAQRLDTLEPEYISFSADGTRALVTLQENNAIAVLDLGTNTFTSVRGLGEKDFRAAGNAIDPKDGNGTALIANPTPVSVGVKGLYQPDGIASFVGPDGRTYYVIANEGDAEAPQLARAGTLFSGIPSTSDLNRLNVLRDLSTSNNLVTIGGRSISILDENGIIVSDSKNDLEVNLIAQLPNLYNDGRSDDKGVEPEGVSVMTIEGRKFAFISLERAGTATGNLASVLAVFDVTDPNNMVFKMFIRNLPGTPEGGPTGQQRAEGVLTFQDGGRYYLAVSNESDGTGPFTTNFYEIQPVPEPEQIALITFGALGLVPFLRRRKAAKA